MTHRTRRFKALQAKLAAQSPAGIADQLAQAKAANDKYQSVDAAKADGYVADAFCVSSPQGAMGIHYVNAPALADSTVDPTTPETRTVASGAGLCPAGAQARSGMSRT